MSALTVPDNIPADVLKAVQSFLDGASEADNTGGISIYGLYCLSESQQLCFAGCSSHALREAVVEAIAVSAAMEKIAGGGPCMCPSCRPAKADEKAVPNLFKRIFGRAK